MHPMPGTVFKYISLANACPGPRRLYGMQFYGLEPHREPDRTIEQMAARYIAEMRILNSDGPYRLLGYSLGGKITFEMAKQLLAADLPLGMVALADASLGVPSGASPQKARTARCGWGSYGSDWSSAKRTKNISAASNPPSGWPPSWRWRRPRARSPLTTPHRR
jgi:thioesterase domain-containing protein